jgi:hypothetical protein
MIIVPCQSRQNGVGQMKIPLNLPLQREIFYSPFFKRGMGDFARCVIATL